MKRTAIVLTAMTMTLAPLFADDNIPMRIQDGSPFEADQTFSFTIPTKAERLSAKAIMKKYMNVYRKSIKDDKFYIDQYGDNKEKCDVTVDPTGGMAERRTFNCSRLAATAFADRSVVQGVSGYLDEFTRNEITVEQFQQKVFMIMMLRLESHKVNDEKYGKIQ